MSSGIRGIVVCVNYSDLLQITLQRNMRFLDECVVVTSPADQKTKDLVATVPNVRLFETDAFYRHGAKFNKGLAMEEGFDVLGRHGWILIWDADILLPDDFDQHVKVSELDPTRLYGPNRLILRDPKQWTPDYQWKLSSQTYDKDFPGYFQLFHADDPHVSQRPWYDVTFAHAGGGDGYFATRWRFSEKTRFQTFKVLHLGPRDANWFGRASEYADGSPLTDDQKSNQARMKQFLAWKGWGVPKTVEEFDSDRVEVPGAKPTEFKLLGANDVPQPPKYERVEQRTGMTPELYGEDAGAIAPNKPE